jgi:HD-GYP domain-containing protein (c-di-GMP phosphodiesterase class II)
MLLLLFVVGVVPLLWTSYTLVRRSREILEFDQKNMQLDKARSLSQQVAAYMRSLESQVDAVARTLEVDNRPLSERIARIRATRALERYVGEQSPLPFYSMSVVDTTCTGAGSGVQLPETAIGSLLLKGCNLARSGQRMPPREFVLSTSLREPVVVLAEPVAPGGGVVQGAVVAVAGLGPLWTMTREMGQGGIFEVYVVDGHGRLIAHSDSKRYIGAADLSDVEIVRLFLETKGRTSTTVPFHILANEGRVNMLGTYTRLLNESGWGVIVQVSEEKAYHDANRMRDQSLLLVAIVTILAAVLGTIFAGQISQPIRELARGARRLARGDYGTRVTVRSRNELGILSEAFNQMGEEIQKAIEQIRHAAQVNKELFVGSIRMLANAIDEKDPYTRGHSDRVAYYSKAIARHKGLTEEDVEKAYLAGILHDVGKIGIEDKILRKAAALTDDEYAIMKQHTKKGAHILAAVPMLRDMTGEGLAHHENIDGSGYPDGLAGEQIPLLARIISVADAFDAMTTDRPYSKAMTFDVALARLRFLAGKKFDPDCVTAMEQANQAGELSQANVRQATLEYRPETAARAS